MHIARAYDNSTLFAKLYNAFNKLLEIANMAAEADILSYSDECELIEIRKLSEVLCENYDDFYEVLELTEE